MPVSDPHQVPFCFMVTSWSLLNPWVCQARHSAFCTSAVTSCAEFHSPCPHPALNKELPVKLLPWEEKVIYQETQVTTKPKEARSKVFPWNWTHSFTSAADTLLSSKQNLRRLRKNPTRSGLVPPPRDGHVQVKFQMKYKENTFPYIRSFLWIL